MELLVIVILIGLIPASIAKSKGRNFITWWVYGAMLFIIALPHAWLLKTDMKKCPHCAELIKAEARVCRYCTKEIGNGYQEIKPQVKPSSCQKCGNPDVSYDGFVYSCNKCDWTSV